jgi:hypothetical protein
MAENPSEPGRGIREKLNSLYVSLSHRVTGSSLLVLCHTQWSALGTLWLHLASDHQLYFHMNGHTFVAASDTLRIAERPKQLS